MIFTKFCNNEEVTYEMLVKSIKTLSNILNAYYNCKVFILIDEYDAPINSCFLESE